MEDQIRYFASVLEDWAARTTNPGEKVWQWYRGELRLPHPEWGPAETIYQSLLRLRSPLSVRKALLTGITSSMAQLADTVIWTELDESAALELLSSCVDFAPAPELLSSVQRILAHEKASQDTLMVSQLRQALIQNQDDDSLKDLWIGLLRGQKSACLSPAPLSDIRGVCRLGTNDQPAWEGIAEGIGLFAAHFNDDRDRRTLMRGVWKDLAQAWNKPLLDTDWNWKLIQAGVTAKWAPWVFETIPCLFGPVPGAKNQFYLWELSARALKKLLVAKEQIKGAPLWLVTLKSATIRRSKSIDSIIGCIERNRRRFSYRSSKGLEGIVFDVAARMSTHINPGKKSKGEDSVPTHSQRWSSATEDLCKVE